ncbi:MAG: dienelactone hydrolase family protein [Steroidobacteraceae bacterium]
MTPEERDRHSDGTLPRDPSRRDFVTLSAAAGLAASTGVRAADGPRIVEQNVSIQTADGACDAAFFHPASGSHPGVLIWTDIFGLRPAFREFGRRLAADGYAVLIPNPFYRTGKAPIIEKVSSFNFQTDRAKLTPFTTPLSEPRAVESDARAYVSFLDAQAAVNKSRRLGVQGYCFGGPFMMRTAAANAKRVGAGASFHGGGLVTDKPDSPHLLAPEIKARLYVAIAGSDDQRQPDAKDTLREAFAAAGVPAEIEVYPRAQHGWCVPDMPHQGNGEPTYNQPDAERAWKKLLALYHSSLS